MNEKIARKLGVTTTVRASDVEYADTNLGISSLAYSGLLAEYEVINQLNDKFDHAIEVYNENIDPQISKLTKYATRSPKLRDLVEGAAYFSNAPETTSTSQYFQTSSGTQNTAPVVQTEWPKPCELFQPTLLSVDSYRYQESTYGGPPFTSGSGVNFYHLLNSIRTGTGDFAPVPFVENDNAKFSFQITGLTGTATGQKLASGKVFYYENDPFPSGGFSFQTNTYDGLNIIGVNNQSGKLIYRKSLFGYKYTLQIRRSFSSSGSWVDYTGVGEAAEKWVASPDQNNIPQGFVNEEWIFRYAAIGSPAFFRMKSETLQRKEVGCFDFQSSGSQMALRFFVEPDLVYLVGNPTESNNTAVYYTQVGTAPCQGVAQNILLASASIPALIPERQTINTFVNQPINYNLIGEEAPVVESYDINEIPETPVTSYSNFGDTRKVQSSYANTSVFSTSSENPSISVKGVLHNGVAISSEFLTGSPTLTGSRSFTISGSGQITGSGRLGVIVYPPASSYLPNLSQTEIPFNGFSYTGSGVRQTGVYSGMHFDTTISIYPKALSFQLVKPTGYPSNFVNQFQSGISVSLVNNGYGLRVFGSPRQTGSRIVGVSLEADFPIMNVCSTSGGSSTTESIGIDNLSYFSKKTTNLRINVQPATVAVPPPVILNLPPGNTLIGYINSTFSTGFRVENATAAGFTHLSPSGSGCLSHTGCAAFIRNQLVFSGFNQSGVNRSISISGRLTGASPLPWAQPGDPSWSHEGFLWASGLGGYVSRPIRIIVKPELNLGSTYITITGGQSANIRTDEHINKWLNGLALSEIQGGTPRWTSLAQLRSFLSKVSTVTITDQPSNPISGSSISGWQTIDVRTGIPFPMWTLLPPSGASGMPISGINVASGISPTGTTMGFVYNGTPQTSGVFKTRVVSNITDFCAEELLLEEISISGVSGAYRTIKIDSNGRANATGTLRMCNPSSPTFNARAVGEFVIRVLPPAVVPTGLRPIILNSGVSYNLLTGSLLSHSPILATLPSGGVPTGFTISPALSSGLFLNSGNGKITGRVIQTGTTAYQLVASNQFGSSTGNISIKASGLTLPVQIPPPTIYRFPTGMFTIRTISSSGVQYYENPTNTCWLHPINPSVGCVSRSITDYLQISGATGVALQLVSGSSGVSSQVTVSPWICNPYVSGSPSGLLPGLEGCDRTGTPEYINRWNISTVGGPNGQYGTFILNVIASNRTSSGSGFLIQRASGLITGRILPPGQ